MAHFRMFGVLCLSILMLGGQSSPGQDRKPAGWLSGQLVDPDSKPVGNVRLSIRMFDFPRLTQKVLAEGRSDDAGRFRLGPIEPFAFNRYSACLEVEGFARESFPRGRLTVFEGADTDLGKVQLDLGRTYTGLVVDVDGKTLSNADVEISMRRHELGHTVTSVGDPVILKTDANGRFRTPPVPICHLALTVRVPDRQLARVSRDVSPGGEEDLGPIQLAHDAPFRGIVIDETGKGIAGVEIGGTVGHEAITDAEGRFTLRGFAPDPSFQLNVRKPGLVSLVGRVTVKGTSVTYAIFQGGNATASELNGVLIVSVKRTGHFEGKAIDDLTGEPIRVSRAVVSSVNRKPGGEIVLANCPSFLEQPLPTLFRVTYPVPDEYHLKISAVGYQDAETFIPKADELKTIDGLVVKMKRKAEGPKPELGKRTLTGMVTRDGKPVKTGFVSVWALGRTMNVVNAPVAHGRMVAEQALEFASVPIRDGVYNLELPTQGGRFLVVQEPGQPVTQVEMVKVAMNEKKTLDINCVEGGRIKGQVKGVPQGWEGYGWVVAFNRTGVLGEARIDRNGHFELPALPPGEFGLKVGHDCYEDPETLPGKLARENRAKADELADAWKQAKVLKVESGKTTEGVEVEWPR